MTCCFPTARSPNLSPPRVLSKVIRPSEGALVVGTGRFQPALIIGPKVHPIDPKALIEEIWPIVQRANQEAAAHGKISRGRIILTSPDKPFVRAG